MGQSAIIIGVAATLIVGIYLFASTRTTNQTDVQVAEYEYKVLAREAAVTGLNLTLRKLVDDPDNWDTNPSSYGYPGESYHGASFSVTVDAIDADTVDVESRGVRGSGLQVIQARYVKGYTTIAVPPSFKYAIISDDDLTLNGQAEILAVDGESNANIHANDDLTINGNGVHIEGYGSFDEEVGSGRVNPEKAIDDVFDPNNIEYPVEDQPDNLIEGENIEIPSLDPSLYDEIGESHAVIGGDYSFTDEVIDFRTWADTSAAIPDNVGTVDNPFRLYINGDLTISGNVSLLGYVQVVTYGSISISGDVTASVTPVPEKNAPQEDWDAWREANIDAAGNTTIGWYSNQDITVSGSSSVVGQLYANGTIALNGGGGESMNIIGGVTSSNVSINVNGGVVIQYAEISKKVVIPGFNQTVPEGVRLIAWAEW